jgi:hypothetical protein
MFLPPLVHLPSLVICLHLYPGGSEHKRSDAGRLCHHFVWRYSLLLEYVMQDGCQPACFYEFFATSSKVEL